MKVVGSKKDSKVHRNNYSCFPRIEKKRNLSSVVDITKRWRTGKVVLRVPSGRRSILSVQIPLETKESYHKSYTVKGCIKKVIDLINEHQLILNRIFQNHQKGTFISDFQDMLNQLNLLTINTGTNVQPYTKKIDTLRRYLSKGVCYWDKAQNKTEKNILRQLSNELSQLWRVVNSASKGKTVKQHKLFINGKISYLKNLISKVEDNGLLQFKTIARKRYSFNGVNKINFIKAHLDSLITWLAKVSDIKSECRLEKEYKTLFSKDFQAISMAFRRIYDGKRLVNHEKNIKLIGNEQFLEFINAINGLKWSRCKGGLLDLTKG